MFRGFSEDQWCLAAFVRAWFSSIVCWWKGLLALGLLKRGSRLIRWCCVRRLLTCSWCLDSCDGRRRLCLRSRYACFGPWVSMWGVLCAVYYAKSHILTLLLSWSPQNQWTSFNFVMYILSCVMIMWRENARSLPADEWAHFSLELWGRWCWIIWSTFAVWFAKFFAWMEWHILERAKFSRFSLWFCFYLLVLSDLHVSSARCITSEY